MKVTFYISSSEKNRLDKTSYLDSIGTLSGVLKDASSVVNPIITFEIREIMTLKVIDDALRFVKDSTNQFVIADVAWKNFVAKTNYAYIDAFGRYYYITDIVALTNELFEIHFASDVLMSFKDQIRALSAYINRNEFVFDPFIEDNLRPTRMDKSVYEFIPIERDDEEDPSKVNTQLGTGQPTIDSNTVLTTVTSLGPINSNAIPAPSLELPFIRTDSFISGATSASYVGSVDHFDAIFKEIIREGKQNYFTFIKSFVAYPFNIPGTSDTHPVGFGDDGFNPTPEFPVYKCPWTYSKLGQYFVISDFIAPTPSGFADFAPSSIYEIYLPFYGWTDLDVNICGGHNLIVYYSVNYEDGSGNVYLYDVSDDRLIFSSPCQIGIKLAWSVSNAQEIEAQKNALGLNLAVGILGSTVSTGLGVVTGNPVSITGGIMGGIKTVTGFISSSSMLFPKASATFNGGFSTLFAPLKVKIRKTSRIYSPDTGFAHQFGKPLNQVRALSSLSGYTRIGQIHLDGISGAFSGEMDDIETLLANGVYF